MPADFVKCVDALVKEGKEKGSAYAICTMQYKKRHKGHTPQHDEEMMDDSSVDNLTPTDEEIAMLSALYELVEEARAACKKKKK